MLVDETETPGAEPEIPAPAEQDGADTPEPAKDVQPSFRQLFTQAREAKPATEAKDDESEDDPADEPDETIPDDEAAGEDEDEESKAADDKESADTKAAERSKQPDGRTRKYKEVVAENEKLQTEAETTRTRLDTLEKQFENHGGVDVVEAAIEAYDKLANGKAVELIDSLPAVQRQKVVSDIFQNALTDERNRVHGVNTVLKQDFGLTADLDQPRLEKIFEFVVHRLNEDPSEFDSFLERELEFANTPEKEVQRLRAENERLKQPNDPKTDQPSAPESPEAFAVRMETTYRDFEDTNYSKVAAPLFANYGLAVTDKDPAEIREAKELLQRSIRSVIAEDMRGAKAFEPLIPFWLSGDEKDLKTTFYGQAAKQYERAMKARVETALKTASRLFGGAKAKAAPPSDATLANPKIPAPGGKTAITPKKQDSSPTGFKSAFRTARENAGTSG
jgi:hypothetical protein